ncbi:alpha/beta hydrolase [Mycobacterium sp.]|uniref:alpha/beta fold hydrolase n=1 Tax=Mycobacterium sp. TaxID=1785 RepID=UPI002D4CD78F|nr:alpha/beta hydrolase [Mycobacterium sp.]HZA11457.1 alpha/beta hydrolase [Mycobacterium sp.]
MTRRRNAWLAGVAGVSAVGAVAGVSAARTMGRRKTIPDPYADEDFHLLDADRSCVVTTTDGVPLMVRETGPVDAPLTVVFAHGFCMRMGAFHFQRARLAGEWGSQVRMVFYDQRGHGESGEAPPDTYTIEQLGEDLEVVLKVMVPRGPVVLVGHSMGGMTAMSHAHRYPQQYGSRIIAVALIASAAKGLSESPLGEILENPALEGARAAVRYAPGLVHRARTAVAGMLRPILRAASYGDHRVSRRVVEFSEQMIHETPVTTLVEFLRALEMHDETAALPTLAKVPVLILCGDHDQLTPLDASEAMAAELPDAERVVVGGAGHLVQLERPDVVNDALMRLVDRAMPSKLVMLTRRVREKVRRRG